MANDIKTQSDLPNWYVYQDTGGKWFKSDAALTREINRHVFLGRDFDQHGRAFYPQWNEPEFKSDTKAAWYLTADGERRIRWLWKIVEHKKSHGHCIRLDKGQCAIKVPMKLGWNIKTKCWEKITPPDAATKDEVRKIEHKI